MRACVRVDSWLHAPRSQPLATMATYYEGTQRVVFGSRTKPETTAVVMNDTARCIDTYRHNGVHIVPVLCICIAKNIEKRLSTVPYFTAITNTVIEL